MLRAVRLSNFANFREDQIFSFKENGVYFFVGQNESGQTSVCEAIRQCLCLTFDTCFSQIPDISEPSYIICKYDIPQKHKSDFSNCENIFTSIVYIPNAKSNFKYARHVLLWEDSELNNIYHEHIESKNGSDAAKQILSDIQTKAAQGKNKKDVIDGLKCCLEKSKSDYISLLQSEMKSLAGLNNNPDNGASSNNIATLLGKLEKSLVITIYGHRSLGPFQWSQSDLITKKGWESICKKARKKCEIINYFLSQEGTFNKEEESKLFRLINDGANYSFESKGGQVLVKVDEESVEVLKLSEGIMEAKYISLLLTSTEFCTIVLEEPGRGMLPLVIQRIRDFVLPAAIQKTIIIVTNNSRLMSTWSIPRTYKFYRKKQEKGWSCSNVDISRVIKKDKDNIVRLLASEDNASVLFASTVIFVEGKSDFIFVKALIAYILNPKNKETVDSVLRRVHKKDIEKTQQFEIPDTDDNDNDLQKISIFMASLHVVPLDGKLNKQKWHNLSKDLKFSRLFLLDKDAVVQVNTELVTNLAENAIRTETKKLLAMFLNNKQGQSQNPHQKSKGKELVDSINSFTDAVMAKIASPITHRATYGADDGGMEENLSRVKEEWKEEIEKIVNNSDDLDMSQDLGEELNHRLNKYFYLLCKDLGKQTCDNPLQESYKVERIQFVNNEENWIVSQDLKVRFSNLVKDQKWEEASKCLEEGGVFVWRTGDLEDAFKDLLNTTDNYSDRMGIIYRFHCFSVELVPKKEDKNKTQRKLFIHVSDENISHSINYALKLINDKSDITYFLRFLFGKALS